MEIPIYVYIIDYILGVVMYTLIGRSAMNIFQKEDSEFFFMKAFVKLTNPILNLFIESSFNPLDFIYFIATDPSFEKSFEE